MAAALTRVKCTTCASAYAIGRCGACYATSYCSKRCQRLHYPEHRSSCRLFRAVTSRQASGDTTDRAWEQALFIGACETCDTFTTRICSRCITTFYCSPACQVSQPTAPPMALGGCGRMEVQQCAALACRAERCSGRTTQNTSMRACASSPTKQRGRLLSSALRSKLRDSAIASAPASWRGTHARWWQRQPLQRTHLQLRRLSRPSLLPMTEWH